MSLLCHGNVHAFRHGTTSAIRSESTFTLHKCFSFKKVQNRRNRSIGYFDIDHNSLFWSVSFTVVLIRLGKVFGKRGLCFGLSKNKNSSLERRPDPARMNENHDILDGKPFKVIVFGEAGVGKSGELYDFDL